MSDDLRMVCCVAPFPTGHVHQGNAAERWLPPMHRSHDKHQKWRDSQADPSALAKLNRAWKRMPCYLLMCGPSSTCKSDSTVKRKKKGMWLRSCLVPTQKHKNAKICEGILLIWNIKWSLFTKLFAWWAVNRETNLMRLLNPWFATVMLQ